MSGACKSCGAPITWAQSENGRAMPVEASASGNIILCPAADPREAPIAKVIGSHRPGQPQVRTLRYVSHFATCPNAAEHRKVKR